MEQFNEDKIMINGTNGTSDLDGLKVFLRCSLIKISLGRDLDELIGALLELGCDLNVKIAPHGTGKLTFNEVL